MQPWIFRPNSEVDAYWSTLVFPVNPPDYTAVPCQHMKPFTSVVSGKTLFVHRLIFDFTVMPNPISTDIVNGIQLNVYDQFGNSCYWLTVLDMSLFFDGTAPPNMTSTNYMLACLMADF